ncbi:DUF72 domain-containing protein [bacterium BMS3Abin03]|nr:DUF72 domain-containing protein [bacterium BMS3Abin03]
MTRFGTCSWKYDSWKGIIYSNEKDINYLQEYSRHYSTVEIDQWFWSLFPQNKVLLPDKNVVEEYNSSTPDDFLFTIKVPNSLTLTHFYNRNKKEPLVPNPYFLSVELFNEFISSIKSINKKTACLIFQFEYLNKQKMKSLNEFQTRFRQFHSQLNGLEIPLAVEIRNPDYLNENYFSFINDLNMAHVFLEGYFMPPVAEIYNKYKKFIKNFTVLRLHGTDRTGIEKISKENWDKIYIDRSGEILKLVKLIKEIQRKEVDIFAYVNNHFEGSAPLTIRRIQSELKK